MQQAEGRGTILINGSHPEILLKFRSHLIRDFIANGYRVHTSCPDLTPEYARKIEELGATPEPVALQRTRMSAFSDLAYFLSLRRTIKRVGADFVLNYTIKPNIWGSLAARSCKVRSASMVTGLGFAFIEGQGFKRAIAQRIAHVLYRLATSSNSKVIFQNPDDLADFQAAGCLSDPRKAEIVNGSGVDLSHFAVTPLPNDLVFLSTARLLRSKGLEEYADAARAVRKQYPEARFLLAGMLDRGPDAIEKSQLDLWVADGLEYLGLLADVRPTLAEASIFVLPSWREGTPRAVLEAMACGRPIITTDAPGCRETVQPGVNGILVPIRDSKALAEAMIQLAGDRELQERMGKASRAIAEEKYMVAAVNRDMMNKLGL